MPVTKDKMDPSKKFRLVSALKSTTIQPLQLRGCAKAGRARWGASKPALSDGDDEQRGHQAEHTRGEEGRQVAARQRAGQPGAVGDAGGAKLVAGEDPTKDDVGPVAAEAIDRQPQGRRDRRDPVEAVEDRKERQTPEVERRERQVDEREAAQAVVPEQEPAVVESVRQPPR